MLKAPFIWAASCCLLVSVASAEQVVFSEILYQPSDGGHEFVEVQNLTATPFDIAKWKFSDGVAFTFPDFTAADATASFLKAFELIVICSTDPATFRAATSVPADVRVFGPWTGALSNGGERVTLENKNGVAMCSVRYGDRSPWPLAADGTGQSLVLADTSYAIDDYRVWNTAAPSPGFAPVTSAEERVPNPEVNLSTGIPYVEYADTWDFNDQNVDLGTAWKEPAYSFTDPGWTMEEDAGNNGGLYGFETQPDILPAPKLQTSMLDSEDIDNHIAYYFRKEFTYNGQEAGAAVTIDAINDDGVFFYLNGIPIGGAGIGANAGWKETAGRTVPDATEELAVATNNGAALVQGTNVLAAQVHQTSNSSSDCIFGARLSIAAPSSAGVVINEVLPGDGGFIEFFNPTASPIDIGGWFLSDSPNNLTQYRIPGSVPVAAAGFATVATDQLPFPSGSTTTLYLTAADGTTLANAISGEIPPDGRSLGRKPEGSDSWYLFVEPSLGTSNGSLIDGLSPKINELGFTADGTSDWVEIYNPGTSALDLSGLSITSQPDFSDRTALSGSVGPGGYASFVLPPYSPDGGELTLYLVSASDQLLHAVAVPHVASRGFSAAYPDGSDEFYVSTSGSRDAANNPDRETGIVFSELMLDPPSNHRDGEFIELFNRGASTIDLSGWEFSDGVDYTFPAGTTIASGGYLVIAANEALTRSAHPGAPVVGQYEGQLANGGELLRLVDSFGNLADVVHYHTGGSWPQLAGGQGSSMELKHPDMDNSQASAWEDSDESDKSVFQTYTISERYERLRTGSSATDDKELHLQAVGDAHLAFKNMSLTRNSVGTNILPNNGATVVTNGNAATGWLCQGTHYASEISNGEFHLISDGHGDIKANRCEIDIIPIQDNDTLTFTFDARWVSGKPTLVVETWDRSFGGIIHMPVPPNLGTPGAPNSSALTSAAPVVSALRHSPSVPSSSDPVVISAKVSGSSQVNVVHRADSDDWSSTNWNTTAMTDDGNGGDEVAGDGVFSATLTGYQTNTQIVQFYVRADTGDLSTTLPRSALEKPAMWIVDDRNQASDLRTQRFIMSARDVSASGRSGESSAFNYAFPRLSNHYFNATFISDEDSVIYNCEFRKSGSPWTRSPDANFSRGKWKPPGDRKFRGYSKRSIDNDPSGNRIYHNRIIRYWLYLFGHPANENEFVRVIMNDESAELRADIEPNANDFLKRNWADGAKGELYRIDDDWWFDDDWSRGTTSATWDDKRTNEPERYSGEWIKRSRESEFDFSSFINWVETVDGNRFSREDIERMADIDMMAANAVARGWCDDWDTLTRNRGKNGYFLRRPTDGKWMLIQWDSDLTFGDTNAAFIGNLPGVGNFFNKAYVRQRVNYYLGEMIDKYTDGSPRLEAWLQMEEDASPAYSSNASTYNTWNRRRVGPARSELGPARLEDFDVTSGDSTSLSTASDTVALEGTSSYKAFSIGVVGHPEAVWEFDSQTTWTLSGIQLEEGENSLVVQSLDVDGTEVGSETFTVNKIGNAAPAVALDADPGSYNIEVGKDLTIDAAASYDPEGTALTYSWSVMPAAQLSNPTPASATIVFTSPGIYTVIVTATDEDNQQTVAAREVAAYTESGWSSFSDETLGGQWALENIEVRDGDSLSGWVSLDDRPNSLTLKVEEDSAKPLTMSGPTHPTLWQDLPTTGNWSFQTDMVLASVQQGDFFVGIIVETMEGGTPTRYTFGVEDGDFLRVKRATGGNYSQILTMAFSSRDAVLRASRSGDALYFDIRLEPGVWENVLSRPVAAGTTSGRAGLFAATDTPQAVRLEFDYAMSISPQISSPTLEFFRLTEVMYNPVEGSALEFLEFQNTGTEPLAIAGVSTGDGGAFSNFTFGDETMAPGEFGVLVADTAAFRALYGPGPRVFGQWAAGFLSNGGEQIEILDPAGNIIHQFSYDDNEPWPTAADGAGSSLQVINTEGDYNDPANWRSSALIGGDPGSAGEADTDSDGLSDAREAATGTLPENHDTDGDGSSDGSEALAGTDPNDITSLLQIASFDETGGAEGERLVTWDSVPGKNYAVQTSASLTGGWETVGTLLATATTSTFPHTQSVPRTFYRVMVIP